jgi:hypothetical protein
MGSRALTPPIRGYRHLTVKVVKPATPPYLDLAILANQRRRQAEFTL